MAGPGKPKIPIPTQKKPDEKRRELRVPLRVLRVESDAGADVFFGYAGNLSLSGMFIQTPNPKEVGTQFKLRFRLPEVEMPVSLLAEVIWIRQFTGDRKNPPGMGLKFVEVTGDGVEEIRRFVESTN